MKPFPCKGFSDFSRYFPTGLFKKLEDAQANYPQWVAAIAGKMGEATETGFVLFEPNIQVFEKKPKEAKPTES